jgi:hypothetical protein
MRLLISIAAIGVALFLPGSAAADPPTPPPQPQAAAPVQVIGKAKIVTGGAFVVRGGNKTQLKVDDALNAHDVLETAPDGSLGITFTDNTSFSIGPKSSVAIDNYFFDPKNLKGNLTANLKKGSIMVRSGELTRQQPGSVQIKTPRTTLGVRGTTFVVSVEE